MKNFKVNMNLDARFVTVGYSVEAALITLSSYYFLSEKHRTSHLNSLGSSCLTYKTWMMMPATDSC